MNRPPFAPDEWYHCYTRGVDKRMTFANKNDYQRFLQLLYLANSDAKTHRSDLRLTHGDIFSRPRGKQLVSIVAFCLMPNHFHIVLCEVQDNGISRFMQKIGTAYAMYFNIKNERIGNLFVKPFRSKHIADDAYLKHVVRYIHLNPLEIFEPKWKQGLVAVSPSLEKKLCAYPYSSLPSYQNVETIERAILDPSSISLADDGTLSLGDVLADAREYYATLTNVKVTP